MSLKSYCRANSLEVYANKTAATKIRLKIKRNNGIHSRSHGEALTIWQFTFDENCVILFIQQFFVKNYELNEKAKLIRQLK